MMETPAEILRKKSLLPKSWILGTNLSLDDDVYEKYAEEFSRNGSVVIPDFLRDDSINALESFFYRFVPEHWKEIRCFPSFGGNEAMSLPQFPIKKIKDVNLKVADLARKNGETSFYYTAFKRPHEKRCKCPECYLHSWIKSCCKKIVRRIVRKDIEYYKSETMQLSTGNWWASETEASFHYPSAYVFIDVTGNWNHSWGGLLTSDRGNTETTKLFTPRFNHLYVISRYTKFCCPQISRVDGPDDKNRIIVRTEFHYSSTRGDKITNVGGISDE